MALMSVPLRGTLGRMKKRFNFTSSEALLKRSAENARSALLVPVTPERSG